ncbi:MAG: hypothetical protein QOK24_2771 [Verrucomicrobiota bacterium]
MPRKNPKKAKNMSPAQRERLRKNRAVGIGHESRDGFDLRKCCTPAYPPGFLARES